MSKQAVPTIENFGEKWLILCNNPAEEVPRLLPLVLEKGATREAWRVDGGSTATMLMVYPLDAPLRTGLLLHGKPGELMPVSLFPFLEGLPNDLTVEQVQPWTQGVEATVWLSREPEKSPLTVYTPLFFRDKDMLTLGVQHTFLLSGLASGVRRALLDELSVTEGPQFEAYAEEWLSENPGKSRIDVPQLRISLQGARIMQSTERGPCEYQLRAPISSVEETTFADETVYIFGMEFDLESENPLRFSMYVPKKVCKLEDPKIGDEIDALVWLQGRIVDMPA